jgi:hypothetical protein
MRTGSFQNSKRCLALALLTVITAWSSHATSTVLPGWDLLETLPGTAFMGVPFTGVPLGSYDFGGGPVGVGNADAIVQRLAAANGPSGTIPIELVALQLVSVIPVDLGAGLAFHYITLQSARGGPASPGSMTINFGPEADPHGTFDSFFDVFFDLRVGSLSGPIIFTDDVRLTSSGNPWSHQPPLDALLIDGVNHNLNGTDMGNDFWPGGVGAGLPGTPVIHSAQGENIHHIVGPAVPDAGATWTLLLIALGFCGLGQLRCKLAPKDT